MASTREGLVRVLLLLVVAGVPAAALLGNSWWRPSAQGELAAPGSPAISWSLGRPLPASDRPAIPPAQEQGGEPSRAASPHGTQAPVRQPAVERDRGSGMGTLSTPPALPSEVRTEIPEDTRPGPPAATNDATLLEVQLGRLARRVMKVYGQGNQTLVPLGVWLELAEVQHTAAASRITGRLQPSRMPIVVDGDSGIARLGNRRLALDSSDIRLVDGEVYGSLGLLSGLFGVSATRDEENAALVFLDPEGLPLAQRLRREAARSIMVGGNDAGSGDLVVRVPEETLPGLALGYEVRGSSRPGAVTSYDLGMATGLLGGSAVLRASGTSQVSPRLEGSWWKAWPRRRWLTQLRLGEGMGTGPRPQVLRGASISNAPIHRAVLVEDLPFAGSLPPDWSVEAYRAGRLIGFDSAGSSGRYSLTLPVHYGENPVEFVAYGPFGEVRTFNRTFRALPSMVPPGAVEYAISVGECGLPACDGGANLDLRYGASRRWTLRAGMDGAWGGAGGARSHPYAGVVTTPTNALGVEVEAAANLLYRTGLRLEPTTALRLTADYVAYSDSGSASPFLPPGTREQWTLYGRLMPGRGTGATTLEAQATRTLTTTGARAQTRGGVAFHVADMVLRPYVRGEWLTAASGDVERGYLGLEATLLPRRALGPVLGGIWVQGHVEAEGTGYLSSAAVMAARNLGSAFRIEGGTRWERALSAPIFTLSFVSQLPAIRSTSTVTATEAQPTTLDQSVGGSVLWSSRRGVPLFSSEPSLDRGGVGGRVFIDLNADGRRQSGEPPAPDTRLLVGSRWVTAAADGTYQVWGVPAWEEVLVSVDTTSLASPWWTPGFAVAAVTPTPNLIRSIDVPIVIGGVLEGSLLLDQPTARLLERPLPIVLTHRESGTRKVVESFSDGSFYHMGLPPGRYEAMVEDSVASRFGLRSDAVRFELAAARSPGEPGATVRGLRIVLRAREP